MVRGGDPAVHPDAYAIGRISTEFFLRGFEVIGQARDNILGGMIVMTMLADALGEGDNKPFGIRELARRLDVPFETVRRQVRKLVLEGACHLGDGGICLAPSLRQDASTVAMMRRIHLDAVRMLDDLRRIKVGNYRPPRSPSHNTRTLSKEQTIVVRASIRLLLLAMKFLRGFSDGDLMSGLVFTAIRAANVKHVTNKPPDGNREILSDSDRRPVSMMAISNSMKLPYETIRRHAAKLIKQGKCVRVGRDGLIVPAIVFHRMPVESNVIAEIVFGLIRELRASGMKV